MRSNKQSQSKASRDRSVASPLMEQLAARPAGRKRTLDLLGRVVLNGRGASFFAARGSALHRFDCPDGDFRYGFRLRSIDVPWLRRLLRAQFVDKAEFPVREVGAVKHELSDLSRLVVFSLLHGYFNSAVLSRLMDTDVIHRWNRQHPNRAIDAKNAASPPELRSAMEHRKHAVDQMKTAIADPVRRSLKLDTRRSAEEADRLSLFAADLLDALDPLAYFVLLASPPEKQRSLVLTIGEELSACLAKTDLADYIVLMVLELMNAAERTTLIEAIGPGRADHEIRGILEDQATRTRMLAELPHGLSASMIWSLSRKWSPSRWRYRLRLALHDGTSSYEEGKRLFDERGSLLVRDRSLQSFYEQGTGPYGDDGLGWYYLSFLADACRTMGIGFDASVREKANRGTAAVNLVFVF